MPKIVQYKLPPGGTVIDLADGQSTALEIEGVDSKDYLIVTTVDGSEAITIKGGGSAGLSVHENNQVRSTVADGWVFLSSDPTDTSPNICPSQKDLDTGIGHGAGGNTNSDQLSLIAGGVEGIRLTESGGAMTVAITGAVSHTGALEAKGDLSVALSGTFTATNGSAEITSGSGTAFDTQIFEGSAIEIFEGTTSRGIYRVTNVGSAAALTLDSNVSGLSSSPKTGMTGKTDPTIFDVKSGDDMTLLAVTNRYVRINGRGGPSTSEPASQEVCLYIDGDDNATNNANATAVQINSSGSNGPQLKFSNSGSEMAAFFTQSSKLYFDTESSSVDMLFRPGKSTYLTMDAGAAFSKFTNCAVEIENASPTLTFDNSTAEDTDGGRESQMDFTGLKTGGGSPAAVTMARVQGSHDGTGDDSKGKISFLTSDGSSLAERFRIHNDGKVGLGSAGLSRSELFCVRQSFTGGEELALIENTGDGNALTVQAASGTASTKVFDVKRAAGSMLTAFGDGKITTGGETSALCKAGGIHLLTGTQTGGTASTDAQDLVIESNATEIGITLLGSNTHRSRLQFGKTANSGNGAIAFDHSTNDMTFWNDGGHQKFYFLDEGYVQVNTQTPTAMLAAEGNLITQGAGTLESISTATVTGSGTSFTTVLEVGSAIKFTNDAGGTEIRTVGQINSNTELVLTETPGATGASRGTKTYFIDPALLSLTTGDSVTKFISKNSRIGINEADPGCTLHIVGPGGTTGFDPAIDTDAPTVYIDSSNGASHNRAGLMLNTDGSVGSVIDFYQSDTRRMFIQAQASTQSINFSGALKLNDTSSNVRFGIDSDGPVWVGSNSTSLSNNEFEVTNGSRFIAFDIQNTTSALNFGGDGLGSANKKEMTIGSHAASNIKFSKYGIAFAKYQLGEVSTWNDDQTNAHRTVYLDDSNTDLNVQFQMGNVGMIQLVDNVDKIKLWGLPGFAGVMTFTLRIKQHSSAPKTLSYSTIEFSTGAPGSSALSGTTTFNWAGGASHVMSTGTNNIDIVQFTAFCDTTNNVDVYASVIGQDFS